MDSGVWKGRIKRIRKVKLGVESGIWWIWILFLTAVLVTLWYTWTHIYKTNWSTHTDSQSESNCYNLKTHWNKVSELNEHNIKSMMILHLKNYRIRSIWERNESCNFIENIYYYDKNNNKIRKSIQFHYNRVQAVVNELLRHKNNLHYPVSDPQKSEFDTRKLVLWSL